MASGIAGGFDAVDSVCLVEDVAHVLAYGSDTDERFFADLPVGLPSADEAQDFDFPLAADEI